MARPAASSAARLMRRPDESFSTDLPKDDRRGAQVALRVEGLDVGVDPDTHLRSGLLA